MSPAQVRFLDEHAPAYLAWLDAVGHSVGIKMEPWQKRTVEAMIKNGFLTEDGHVTKDGKDRWLSIISKRDRALPLKPRILDNRATLMIVDDPETIA
ncbi:hypothetical protein [Bradyrhizobium ottawaense]|uniref:Uncharacterized protein n=1 Tax=Bradyrhizobium ottawaense TaxID=931866 RepID=A0ABY0QHH8_9BRAD|nr:hypothetical protein [Bradyrhizobium ottawaense]SDH37462.1 hypothetical protein SAMN05444163_0004 [Bradyrhizobium ottawaense]SDK45860.1 hypothetical protein SAMN05444163_8162 [Bradyrhizobium ottawaense]